MAKRKREMQTATPETLKDRVMLRVSEYSRLTGTPAPTVYKYLASGEIPVIHIGGTLRIPVSALLQQIEQKQCPQLCTRGLLAEGIR